MNWLMIICTALLLNTAYAIEFKDYLGEWKSTKCQLVVSSLIATGKGPVVKELSKKNSSMEFSIRTLPDQRPETAKGFEVYLVGGNRPEIFNFSTEDRTFERVNHRQDGQRMKKTTVGKLDNPNLILVGQLNSWQDQPRFGVFMDSLSFQDSNGETLYYKRQGITTIGKGPAEEAWNYSCSFTRKK